MPQGTNTDGSSQVNTEACKIKEVCNQVEEAFEKQIPDKHGFAAREKFAQMLEALGLSGDEAILLLNECDPLSKSRLQYMDFLDFIFGRTVHNQSQDIRKEQLMKEQEQLLKGRTVAEQLLKGSFGAAPKTSPKTVDDAKKGESEECKDKVQGRNVVATPTVETSKEKQQACADKAQENLAEHSVTPSACNEESIHTIPTMPQKLQKCHECRQLHAELFLDPTDDCHYCEQCWTTFYNSQPKHLVDVVKGKLWPEDQLIKEWTQKPIPGWGYRPYAKKAVTAKVGDPTDIGEHFFPVQVRLNPGLVGTHARTCTQKKERLMAGEKLCNRYRVEQAVGAGHFTRAVLAIDEQTGRQVCVKKHNGLTVELLTDLLTICRRLESEDKENKYFPQVFDAFYDIEGFTVESLVPGKNCLTIMRENKEHFKNLNNLQVLATQGYRGLACMAKAGVVHCDLKPDNIMWVEPTGDCKEPRVILVDFGCSRLDSRLEDGRNWALSECGAGHVGKWAPEMILRLPITHKADVWGLAVALLELHCGRTTWCTESDTVEVILAQALGLVNARSGLPETLLKQSPLDLRQLYTPNPSYFPVQRVGTFGRTWGTFQEIQPATWGLDCVLGPAETWDEVRIVFANFILAAMNLDFNQRPSAEQMLTHPFIEPSAEDTAQILEAWRQSQKASEVDVSTDIVSV